MPPGGSMDALPETVISGISSVTSVPRSTSIFTTKSVSLIFAGPVCSGIAKERIAHESLYGFMFIINPSENPFEVLESAPGPQGLKSTCDLNEPATPISSFSFKANALEISISLPPMVFPQIYS